MTKFFIDKAGKYLGGFDGAKPPAGAIEIPEPPENGADVWTGTAWDKSGRPQFKDTKKDALILLLGEVAALRPAKATAIQALIDRLNADEPT